jgi:hypothetical protein
MSSAIYGRSTNKDKQFSSGKAFSSNKEAKIFQEGTYANLFNKLLVYITHSISVATGISDCFNAALRTTPNALWPT